MTLTKRILSVLLSVTFMLPLLCGAAVNAGKQYSLGAAGLALIKQFEGFRANAYYDYNHWSIGYGSTCGENEYPNGITEEQASALLVRNMSSYEATLDAFLEKNNITVNQNQYDALVSFTYNLGNPWKKYPDSDLAVYLINGVNKYSEQQIRDAFGLFCRAGGEVLAGLVRRRAAEAALFLTPVAEEAPGLYSDVRAGAWYAGAVGFVSERGILTGTSADCFSPSAYMTRAMAAMSIAKLVGIDISQFSAQIYADVPCGKWYTCAVGWASSRGIVSGVGGGCFNPGGNITRQDFLLIIYNYARSYGFIADQSGLTVSGYPDAACVSGYAQHAVAWGLRAGILSGTDAGTLDPRVSITRAQAAQIIMRFYQLFN